ncbi:MAG: hypothetical protein JNJ59_03985 [Deltaproteobacteria bacterium]|nr:hypothetical protein [Deltaproteobacteria bacterium]
MPVLMWGCGFSIGGSGGDGCTRISQGTFKFPSKRIIPGAIAVRVTQSGVDFLAARIKALVLSFFGADANGRAVIPLGRLGVGSIGTTLGPFDAEVRDLVLTLDLSRMVVRLVPGSSPARLEVYVEDAEIGLVDGTVAGGVDGTFFSGDVACGLGNGPSGRVAKLTMRLLLELATDPNGALKVKVLPSTFDVKDLAISVTTNCNLSECLDGLSPGNTGECLECETICPLGELASSLATLVRDAFDGLVDQLMNALADDLANLVLDGFLNGKPLVIEAELDLAGLLSPLLGWMQSARRLGILARPAGEAFRVSGAGDGLGLDVVLDAGLDAAPAHPCVGAVGTDRIFVAGPRPTFDGLAQTPGGAVPYDLGLGVSAAVINEAFWALWKSGALCIAATTDDLQAISAGRLTLTAKSLDLLLPGAAAIAGPDAPIRLVVLPRLDRGPDYLAVGDGVASPLLGVALEAATVAVEAQVGDGWLRLVGFEADLELGIGLLPRTDGKIEVHVDKVEISRLGLPDNRIFSAARLEVIAPFVVELALGFLNEAPLTFDLGLDGLTSGLGLPVSAALVASGPAGANGDWLALYLRLGEPPVARRLTAPRLAIEAQGPGWVEVRALGIGPADRFRVRVEGGAWSSELAGPGPHRVASSRLWVIGRHRLETRAVDALGRAGEPVLAAELETLAPVDLREAEATASIVPPGSETVASQDGCGGGAGPGLVGALLLLAFARWRAGARP